MPVGARLEPAVFLDKDGTLIENIPYNVDPETIRLVDGATEALGELHQAGYRLVVVSNQSGVARGLFREGALAHVQRRLMDLFRSCGAPLAGFYYCPHHPQASVPRYARSCRCRKPAPGMLLHAAHDLQLDLRRSWMLGDILDDVEAGRLAGCRTILVGGAGETEWRTSPRRIPHFIAPALLDAARVVTEYEHGPQQPTSPRAEELMRGRGMQPA